jgi:hypothetical protein
VGEPARLQLRRDKGWRKPRNTIVVARPSKWGNPFRFDRDARGRWLVTAPWSSEATEASDKQDARRASVHAFRSYLESRVPDANDENYPSDDEIRAELAGRDLACWCPLDEPCHGDVLLDIANRAQPR